MRSSTPADVAEDQRHRMGRAYMSVEPDMVAAHLSRLLREGKAALQPSTVHVCMSFRWTFW